VFTPLHSSANQELFKKYVCNQSNHYEKINTDSVARPSYHLKLKYPLPSLSSMFNLLHSSTNQELFQKHLCNQSSHYEKYAQFLLHLSEGIRQLVSQKKILLIKKIILWQLFESISCQSESLLRQCCPIVVWRQVFGCGPCLPLLL